MKILQYETKEINTRLNIVKFVVTENYKHHCKCFSMSNNIENEVSQIYEEEKNYQNSKIFVSFDYSKQIMGTIRVIKWNNKDILPVQKLFGINPIHFVKNTSCSIWHIGRLAIKKGTNNNIFKSLLVTAIAEVCQNENSIAIAECDVKLLKILKILGIEPIILGDSINYLGSETIPVLFSYEPLKNFLDKYNSAIKLPQSVVLTNVA